MLSCKALNTLQRTQKFLKKSLLVLDSIIQSLFYDIYYHGIDYNTYRDWACSVLTSRTVPVAMIKDVTLYNEH